MKNNNKLSFNRFLPLCLIMAIMLSGHAQAAPGGNDGGGHNATQAELDAEIATRQTADTAEAATRQNADTAMQGNLNNAVATQAAVDAGQNTTIQALQSALSQAQTDIANLKALIAPSSKQIGDHFDGGIVFYVDATGQHGLIASLTDLTDGVDNLIPWYNGVYKFTGATGDGIGAGASNTLIIIAAQAADNPTGIFAALGYWSSTEGDAKVAWFQNFSNGNQVNLNKFYTLRVRAVRAFK